MNGSPSVGSVGGHLEPAPEFPPRLEGEEVLLRLVPGQVKRVLDLGTGDGRLLARLAIDRPRMVGVGLDNSTMMLAAGRQRFAGHTQVELVEHNLTQPLPDLGRFDAVVSASAVDQLEPERKQELYGEVFEVLTPGGRFATFEHIASPAERLHQDVYGVIGAPLAEGDPFSCQLGLGTKLRWLREIGYHQVSFHWKWRRMALVTGVKPRDPWR